MPVASASTSAPASVSYQGLSDRNVAAIFAKSRVWVWLQVRKNPAFPKPVKVGPNTTVWLKHEIDAYIEQCIEQSRKDTAAIAA